MDYKSELNSNNTELEEILNTINELPEAESVVGENGATFTPSVSADGVLSWTNDKGLDNPAPVNIKGADGKDGKDGANGTNGKDGTSVTVSNVAESTASGGSNVVTFSDGKSLTVKNGKDGEDGADGYTPVKGTDYWTPDDVKAIEDDAHAYIVTELAKRGQLAPEYAESLEWLEANGDQSKMYVLPDGFIYAWMLTEKEVEGGASYTNLLPAATGTDRKTIYGSDYNGDGVNDGWKNSTRLSSSGSESSSGAENAVTGFVPAKDGNTVYIKALNGNATVNMYIIAYNSSNTKTGYIQLGKSTSATVASQGYTYDATTDIHTIPLTSAKFGSGIDAVRVCAGLFTDTIITVNEEIKEGGGTEIVTEEGWASTGLAFVPADYEDRIVDVENRAFSNTERIISLEKAVENGSAGDASEAAALTRIRNWDKPIYERLTPFLLDADLDIDTTYPKSYNDSTDPDGAYRRQNVQAVYDEYNALCAAHPDFVREITNVEHGLPNATETTFGGLCSDGIQYVRVYEFCEREGRHSNTTNADYWSETKPTFVIVTGIHWEYNGVYSMLHALKLITENPNLRDLRRNCRFIVIPMSNPYCFTTYNNSGGGHYNANGVEIHNNFTVEFNNAIDSTHGTAPLSEVETRYIDNTMRKYADTGVCLLTCHSNASKGSNFIWGSVATKFMCNVSMRLVDLMSYAWDEKYDNYRTAIDTQKVGNSNPQDDGDYRCGFASLSTSSGTETKQALRYGMQGINVEVYERFYLFDPDGSDMALAVSRGAEVYANLLRLLAVTYDHKDKKEYAPNLPWED